MTVIINLVGGPCCGKSTTAAGLFAKMKLSTKSKVELVTEVIKDHVYDENKKVMEDQILITAEQNHRLMRLQDKVDFVISDASLLNGLVYNEFYNVTDNTGDYLSLSLFNRYENIVFLLPRKTSYDQYGRTQTEDEAKQIDELFLKTLDHHNTWYYDMREYTHEEMPDRILDILADEFHAERNEG